MTTTIDYNNLSPSLQTQISQGGGPKITTLDYPGDDTAANPAGGQTITVVGTGFVSGFSIVINNQLVGTVTFVSSTEVTFVTPALSAGSYPLYLINPDGGTAILVPGIQYSGVPTWTTPAGSLGNVYETSSISTTVVATGDAPITYSLASGTLPTGSTLAANGLISGTTVSTENPTTFTFTIAATDAELQDTTRTFNLTVNPDTVTWNSPANNTTYTSSVNSEIANVTLSATSAAGFGITYTANSLPTGLSIAGANITGTPTVVGNSSSLLTATANTSNRSATRVINWVVQVSNDVYFDYVTTLVSANTPSPLPFNDDASTNNFNISIFGQTRPSNYGPYQSGYYSNLFDGTGDELVWSGSTVGSNQYTFECWFYLNVLSGIPAILGTTITSGLNIRVPSATVIQVDAYNNSSTQFTVPTMVIGQWYHLAVCRGASNLTTVFLNGIRSSTGTVGISTSYSASSKIGASVDINNFNGYISNARLVIGSTVYDPTQTTITVPTSPLTAIANTSLLTCQSSRLIDNSTNNFSITRGGDALVSGFIPFTPSSSYSTYGSMYVDGSGDYLSVPDNTAIRLSSTDFTIEFWGYQTTSSAGTTGYFSKGNDYALDNDANRFVLRVPSGNAFIISGNLDQNVWTHIALVRNGATITIYKNGVSLGSASSPTITDSSSALLIGWCSVGSNAHFTGLMSNFRLVKGTAVYTSNFTPPTAPLTAIANTSLLTSQTNQPVNNNVFVDEGTANFLATRNGNTTQGTFSPYGVNYSNYFDGNGDYLSLADNTALAMGSGNWTLECWVYLNSYTGTTAYGFIYDGRPSGVNGFYLTLYQNNGIVRFFTNGTSVIGTDSGTTATLPIGQWTHIAVCKSGSSTKMFFNGSQVGSTYTDNNTYINGSGRPLIGANAITLGDYLNGYVSNLRLVKGTALYTENFTPSTTPLQPIANTSLLTCADNTFIDDSPNRFTITRNGDVSVQKFGPFASVSLPTPYYSAYFDGTGDYLSMADNTALQLGSSDFTWEGWFYLTTDATRYLIYSCANNSTVGAIIVYYDSGSSAKKLYVAASTDGVNFVWNGAFSSTFSLNTWNHVAIVRSGNTITAYQNGTSQYSNTVSGSLYNGPLHYIGARDGGASAFPGYISNVRLVKGTAVYTGNFTPSTTPLTAIANTSLLTCQSSTFIDNSPNNFTVTANGNSQPTLYNPFTVSYSVDQPYSTSVFGGSIYFDGTGDYIDVPNSTLNQLSGAQYTMEMWVYPTVGNVERRIFNKNGSAIFGYLIYIGSGNVVGFRTDTSNLATGLLTADVFRWSHIAVTNDGTTTRLFVNGVLSTSATGVIINNANEQGSLRIGARLFDASMPFTGYMSDVRLVKGTALYTSNFVPPQAPIAPVQNTTLLLNGVTGGIIDSSENGYFETVGDAKISTAITKFTGKTSMSFDGTTDYAVQLSSLNYGYGTGDFTIEFWAYFNNVGLQTVVSNLTSASSVNPHIYVAANGSIRYFTNNADRITGSVLSINTWYHIAVSRASGSTKLFIDGTQSGSTYADSNNYGTTAPLGIGTYYSAGSPVTTSTLNGYISDLRITKGIGRYTTNFTVPNQPFIQY